MIECQELQSSRPHKEEGNISCATEIHNRKIYYSQFTEKYLLHQYSQYLISKFYINYKDNYVDSTFYTFIFYTFIL